jgi:hypothetical protein
LDPRLIAEFDGNTGPMNQRRKYETAKAAARDSSQGEREEFWFECVAVGMLRDVNREVGRPAFGRRPTNRSPVEPELFLAICKFWDGSE